VSDNSARRTIVICVTASRVPLAATAAAILCLLAWPGSAAAWVVVALLAAAEATDMIDGTLARRWGTVSRLGELLDPYCDSISRLMMYSGLAYAGACPAWLVLVLAVRDVSVSYARIICLHTGKRVAARLSGKLKAIVQGTGAIMLAVLLAMNWPDEILRAKVGLVTAIVVAVVTLWSLADYAVGALTPAKPDPSYK